LNADVTFIATPAGRTASDPAATTLTTPWSRIWARSFSPCHVRGLREASGDLVISWTRRARVGGDAWEGGEPLLSEESEAYQVEIIDSGAPIRTISVSSPAAAYTAAQQTTDFGGVTSPLTVRIAQVSARFGVGTRRESIIWV
jgi:hypothetical protein